MMRRGFWFLILLSILLVSGSAQGIPSHENFNEAPQDLYAIIGFLTDIKQLCEESLTHSFDARGTIRLNQTVEQMTYSNESLTTSLLKIQDLNRKISYSNDVLEKLKGKASSYDYLKDSLMPMKELGLNVSSFVQHHQNILTNFTAILVFLSQGKNETAAVQSLGNVKSEILTARTNLSRIQQRTNDISNDFSTDTLQPLIPLLHDLLATYDQYSNDLVSLYYGVEPHLLLFIEKPVVYLGEKIHSYGYFIAARTFIPNQPVSVQLEETLTNTTRTNIDGLYQSNLSIPLDHTPSTYTLTASTTYNMIVYQSPAIPITIQRIPTNITIFSNKTHAYVHEQIRFYGKLVDYKMIGIHANISFHIGEHILNQTTDENGNYSLVFQEHLTFGMYSTYVSFPSQTIYEPCQSQPLNIFIDTPTTLLLMLPQIKIPLGDTFLATGQLYSNITHEPLQQKTIDVFLNTKKVGSGTTNETGWYMIQVSTKDLHEGPYTIYTMFQSDTPQWRTATSQEIQLTIGPAILYYLPYLLMGILLIITVSLFLARKKIMTMRQKQPSPTSIIPPVLEPIRSRLLSQPVLLDEKEFIIDTTGKKRDEFRTAIISRYHSFIARLSTAGILFPLSATHLDIQHTMITKGLSPKSTETITTLFELAMYSPFPFGKKEVTLFNNHIRALIKNLGGKP